MKTIEILKPSFLRAYKENQVDEYFTRAAKLWCERFPEPEAEITTRAYKDDPDYSIFIAKLRKEVRCHHFDISNAATYVLFTRSGSNGASSGLLSSFLRLSGVRRRLS